MPFGSPDLLDPPVPTTMCQPRQFAVASAIRIAR